MIRKRSIKNDWHFTLEQPEIPMTLIEIMKKGKFWGLKKKLKIFGKWEFESIVTALLVQFTLSPTMGVAWLRAGHARPLGVLEV